MYLIIIQDSINWRAGAQLEKHRLRKIFRYKAEDVTFENIFVSFINWYSIKRYSDVEIKNYMDGHTAYTNFSCTTQKT